MNVLLVVYDNGSYIHWFPQGLAYIVSALELDGHRVTIWPQDIHHLPADALTAKLDDTHYDVVGVSACGGYWQYRQLMALSAAVASARRRPYYVLGGHGPAADPAYFLRKTDADACVIGEGEDTAVELLPALGNSAALRRVFGIAWRDGDEVVVNPRRPVRADVDSLPWPSYDAFDCTHYRLLRFPRCEPSDFCMPVLSARGCTFRCTFCFRLDPGYRPRAAAAIVDELRWLQAMYGITYFAFSDELLMSSEARTMELCAAFRSSGLRFRWCANGRLNYATQPVLAAMRDAGCVFINYGIEALDDEVLRRMEKHLTVDEIETGVARTLEAGISPGLNIIWGNLGDTRETLERGVQFLLRHDDCAQLRTIRPVTPYPGTKLYQTAIERGLLIDCADFYKRRHRNSDLLTVNFTDLSDAEFHAALAGANARLIRNHYAKRCQGTLDAATRLYSGDVAFRGFRQS